MSRVGKQPVILPKGIKAAVSGGAVLLEGPKGKDSVKIPVSIKVTAEAGKVTVERNNNDKLSRSLHGTIRALINTAVKGVETGYKKELDILGVGYKAQMKGTTLILNLGFSHPVEIPQLPGLKISAVSVNRISIEGINKQKVGELAAKIRKICPVEPYQGKGIRYVGEEVKKKLGKALAK